MKDFRRVTEDMSQQINSQKFDCVFKSTLKLKSIAKINVHVASEIEYVVNGNIDQTVISIHSKPHNDMQPLSNTSGTDSSSDSEESTSNQDNATTFKTTAGQGHNQSVN